MWIGKKIANQEKSENIVSQFGSLFRVFFYVRPLDTYVYEFFFFTSSFYSLSYILLASQLKEKISIEKLHEKYKKQL